MQSAFSGASDIKDCCSRLGDFEISFRRSRLKKLQFAKVVQIFEINTNFYTEFNFPRFSKNFEP